MNAKSLNDLLYKKGIIQDNHFMISFRKNIFALTVDVNKMFQQVEVNLSHAKY